MKKLYISASLIGLMCLLCLINCKSQKHISQVTTTQETAIRHGQFLIEPLPFTVTPQLMQVAPIDPIKPIYPITQSQPIRVSFSDTVSIAAKDTTITKNNTAEPSHQQPTLHERMRACFSTLVSIVFLVVVIILFALGAKVIRRCLG